MLKCLRVLFDLKEDEGAKSHFTKDLLILFTNRVKVQSNMIILLDKNLNISHNVII